MLDEAEVAASTENHMVEERDAEDFRGLAQTVRDVTIFGARI